MRRGAGSRARRHVRAATVGEVLVDLVGMWYRPRSAHSCVDGAQIAASGKRRRVGLFGEMVTMARVRGVIAARIASTRS